MHTEFNNLISFIHIDTFSLCKHIDLIVFLLYIKVDFSVLIFSYMLILTYLGFDIHVDLIAFIVLYSCRS